MNEKKRKKEAEKYKYICIDRVTMIRAVINYYTNDENEYSTLTFYAKG